MSLLGFECATTAGTNSWIIATWTAAIISLGQIRKQAGLSANITSAGPNRTAKRSAGSTTHPNGKIILDFDETGHLMGVEALNA